MHQANNVIWINVAEGIFLDENMQLKSKENEISYELNIGSKNNILERVDILDHYIFERDVTIWAKEINIGKSVKMLHNCSLYGDSSGETECYAQIASRLVVNGTLLIDESIRVGKHVKGKWVDCLPEQVNIGSLVCQNAKFFRFPKKFYISESLDVEGSENIVALPERLELRESLNIKDCNNITGLPKDTKIGTVLNIEGSGVKEIRRDSEINELIGSKQLISFAGNYKGRHFPISSNFHLMEDSTIRVESFFLEDMKDYSSAEVINADYYMVETQNLEDIHWEISGKQIKFANSSVQSVSGHLDFNEVNLIDSKLSNLRNIFIGEKLLINSPTIISSLEENIPEGGEIESYGTFSIFFSPELYKETKSIYLDCSLMLKDIQSPAQAGQDGFNLSVDIGKNVVIRNCTLKATAFSMINSIEGDLVLINSHIEGELDNIEIEGNIALHNSTIEKLGEDLNVDGRILVDEKSTISEELDETA